MLIGCLMIVMATPSFGQKAQSTRLKAYYEKLPNGDKKISLILTKGKGKSTTGVRNADIQLSVFDLDNEIDLAVLATDTVGEAILFITSKFPFPKNEAGYHTLKAMYNGNDSLKSAKKTIEFLDINISINFEIVDSVKQLTLSAYEIDSSGNKIAVGEVDLDIGVERLYSTLFLDEVETDKYGLGIFEFPNDIPGDSIGTITVIAKINDHADYGTVTQAKKVQWGKKVDYTLNNNSRSLFGEEAPLWMIISVFVVLFGAWFNFMLAVYKVFKMKKLSSN